MIQSTVEIEDEKLFAVMIRHPSP